MGLTNKQKLFIESYLECWNGTQAARKAGYGGDSNALAAAASRLLKNVKVRHYIQARLSAKAMTADEILVRLSEQARSDISDYINDFGYVDFERLKADGKAHLIKKYEIVQGVGGKQKMKCEVYDAQAAMDKLAKAHGLYTDKRINFDIDLENCTVEQLARLAAGENPLNVLQSTAD